LIVKRPRQPKTLIPAVFEASGAWTTIQKAAHLGRKFFGDGLKGLIVDGEFIPLRRRRGGSAQ
jgi:hypothetical protein